MSHVLARVESGRILFLAANQLVVSLHGVGGLADLRRVVVEAVVHVLHVHHVHVAAAALVDHWKLLYVVSCLVTV